MDHTPGPWVVGVRTARYSATDFPLPPFEAMSIGTSNGPEGRQIAFVPLDESNEANARLIAVAPDMKADLERFVALCDEVEGEVPSLKTSGFGHAAKLARLTLAKVKGAA